MQASVPHAYRRHEAEVVGVRRAPRAPCWSCRRVAVRRVEPKAVTVTARELRMKGMAGRTHRARGPGAPERPAPGRGDEPPGDPTPRAL
eukprot:5493998-Prymnesium_polylepis.1